MRAKTPDILTWLGLPADRRVALRKPLIGRMVGIILALLALWLLVLGVTILWQLTKTFFTAAGPTGAPFTDRFVTVPFLIALVGAPFLVWRTIVAQKQADIADQGYVTDQITKAVEALGAEKTVSRIGRPVDVQTTKGKDTRIEWQGTPLQLAEGETVTDRGAWQAFDETIPNVEVRIGALYALERIAQDSLRDHVPVIEIITAYLRQNAQASGAKPAPEPPWAPLPDDATPEERIARAEEIQEWFGVIGPVRDWARAL